MARPLPAHPRGSSQERAYRYIKTRILDRRFPEECRLRAQDLAESIEISRTPVREALGRLEQEGLVRREGGWGFVVRGMSVTEVIDLFEVRETLELKAVAGAMARANELLIIELRELIDESARALALGRPVDSIRIARRFYSRIAEASGNALLARMIESLNERIHMVGLSLAARFPDRPAEVLAENRALLKAFELVDAAGAARILKKHIRRSRALVTGGAADHGRPQSVEPTPTLRARLERSAPGSRTPRAAR